MGVNLPTPNTTNEQLSLLSSMGGLSLRTRLSERSESGCQSGCQRSWESKASLQLDASLDDQPLNSVQKTGRTKKRSQLDFLNPQPIGITQLIQFLLHSLTPNLNVPIEDGMMFLGQNNPNLSWVVVLPLTGQSSSSLSCQDAEKISKLGLELLKAPGEQGMHGAPKALEGMGIQKCVRHWDRYMD